MSEIRDTNLFNPEADAPAGAPLWTVMFVISLLAASLLVLSAAYPATAGAAEAEFAAADSIAEDWQRFLASENPEILDVRNSGAAWEQFLAEKAEFARASAYAEAWEEALAGDYDLRLAAAERYAAAWERSLARDYDLQLAAAERYADAWESFMATWDGCAVLVC